MRTIETRIANHIPYIIINDTYNDHQLNLFRVEMAFLYDKLGGPEKTNAAHRQNTIAHTRKKSGIGVFLDTVYTDRGYSDILNHSRFLFHDEELKRHYKQCTERSLYWKLIETVNFDSTLLQCYGNGDHYESHRDQSLFTAVTTFRFIDKSEGGDFAISFGYDRQEDSYINETFPLTHNQTIIFPSVCEHEVKEVFLKDGASPFEKRWSVAHLMTYREDVQPCTR